MRKGQTRQMSKKSDWWTPASLEKEEEAVAKGGVADPDNDFGSYKIMRESESVKGSKISQHNEVRPQYRAHQLRDFLQHQPITRVLDAGCGLGYTTSALVEAFAGAEVVGVDVSTDAIAYAKKTVLNCDFYVDAIDPDRDFKFGSFDLICALNFIHSLEVVMQKFMQLGLSIYVTSFGQTVKSQFGRFGVVQIHCMFRFLKW